MVIHTHTEFAAHVQTLNANARLIVAQIIPDTSITKIKCVDPAMDLLAADAALAGSLGFLLLNDQLADFFAARQNSDQVINAMLHEECGLYWYYGMKTARQQEKFRRQLNKTVDSLNRKYHTRVRVTTPINYGLAHNFMLK